MTRQRSESLRAEVSVQKSPEKSKNVENREVAAVFK